MSASSTSGNIACYGGTTNVTVSATGGTAPYSGTGNFVESEGFYAYTVTDANGCVANTNITITEPSRLASYVNSTAVLCNGGNSTITVTANGGTSPYTGTGNFTVTAGNYNYTVTDANGCTSTSSISITEPSALNSSSSSGSIACNGATTTVSVSANGGTAPYTGDGNYTVGAGNYSYTVTDANGCTSSTSITVTEPDPLKVILGATKIDCFGGNADVNVVAAGGTAPYSGTGVYNVVSGNYTYTVTDANGCVASASIFVPQPPQLVVSLSSTPILCNGGTSTVSISATGGSGNLYGVGSASEFAGTYTYIVSDDNGCSDDETITISEPTLLTASSSTGSIACNGGTTTVSVSANGGTTPYTGDGNYTVAAGNYSYTVTDANGCTAVTSGSISQPSLVTVNAGSDATVYFGYSPMACTTLNGSSNGGGTGSVSLTWSNGTSGNSTNVCPNTSTTYTLTGTDANGCVATDEVTICVVDVVCFAGNSNQPKVEICHNGNSMCVSPNAVASHLAHGCTLGSCSEANACNSSARQIETIEQNGSSIKLFPNPASANLTVHFDTDEMKNETSKYVITNIMGQIVVEGVLNTGDNSIDISKFEDGIYYLRTFDGINSSSMFIKE